METSQRELCLKLLKFFQIDGKTVDTIATEGELEIFHAIVFRKWDRVQILCATQYGKSLFVALACLVVSCIEGELIAVIAPKDEQAKIIMRYYIDHLGDNILFYSQLEKNTKLERLRMEESKDRITLRNRGGIYVLSAQAGNSQKGVQAAMGAGAKIVLTDEASLIPDVIEATIFRMIAGKGKDAFYCKIGNPWHRNHFLKSWNDPRYHKIFIDYKQGITEGRYTQEFIDEAKRKPHFDILFGCEFPPADIMDERGYVQLFPDELVDKAQRVVEPFGERRLGVDVAEGGGDSNALGLRWTNYAKPLLKFKNEDTMMLPGIVIKQMQEQEVFDQNVFMDSIGVGKGAYDRLREQNYAIGEVKFSERASEETQFVNKRAENYWRFYKWLVEGGALEPNVEWEMLKFIKYRVDSGGRIVLMPKDDMRKQGLGSPDMADAIAMTFDRKSVINKSREERIKDKQVLKEFDAFRDKQSIKPFTGSAYLRR